jgi:hypothetical protein
MRIKPVALIALRRLVGKRRVSQKDKERLFGWSSRCGKQSNAVTIPASPIMPRYATPDAIPAGAWMVTGPFFSYSDTWQHLDRRRDIFDGVSDPKLAKSRQLGTSSEARRIDPHQRREEFFRGHREAYSGGDRDDSAER